MSFAFHPLLLLSLTIVHTFSSATVGSWIPIFKGVDYSMSSNSPSVTLPHLQVVTAFRVDLTDPDVRLFTTPRRSDYIEGTREVGGLTVSDFLRNNQLQAAINANFFDARNYYLPANYPMDLYGLAISQSVVVSPQDDATHAAALLFDSANKARIIYTNWPPADTTGVFTAVAGNYPLVINGQNVARRTGNLETDPRTAFGISQDRRYLYLIGIDGRQPGYSEGAYDYETAEWLLLLGAFDGINMDGGGSTTLVMESSTGDPVELNHSSAVADSGRERTVGSHFGIYAKPLPGFINDLTVLPRDTTATATWTTIESAISTLEYGENEDLGANSIKETSAQIAHSIEIPDLTPDTKYYYRITSVTDTSTNISPIYTFRTTNYVTTNLLFALNHDWKYTTALPSGAGWTENAYNDMSWNGPLPGLLWVDTRGPNEAIEGLSSQMELNPNTGYPYITYYFRTHFTITNYVTGTSLGLTARVDDGMVLYLNGVEIWRLRVPAGATANSLASGYGCEGDATCDADYVVPSSLLGTLQPGDNVLAAEVHNYNARSGDITFGLRANLIVPLAQAAQLAISSTGESLQISWAQSGYRLQSSPSIEGPWGETSLSSPAAVTPTGTRRFFRLIR